jgi:hypothetical protein
MNSSSLAPAYCVTKQINMNIGVICTACNLQTTTSSSFFVRRRDTYEQSAGSVCCSCYGAKSFAAMKTESASLTTPLS